MGKKNPRDATASVVSHHVDRAIAEAIKKALAPFEYLPERQKLTEKRLDVLENLVDGGKGKFRQD
jgi:hypothetical protein